MVAVVNGRAAVLRGASAAVCGLPQRSTIGTEVEKVVFWGAVCRYVRKPIYMHVKVHVYIHISVSAYVYMRICTLMCLFISTVLGCSGE